MNWRSDDVVRDFLRVSIKGFKTVPSLAQVFLSVMEVRGEDDLDELLDGAERDPAIMRAVRFARDAYGNQDTQQHIVLAKKAAPKAPIRLRGRQDQKRGTDGKA